MNSQLRGKLEAIGFIALVMVVMYLWSASRDDVSGGYVNRPNYQECQVIGGEWINGECWAR